MTKILDEVLAANVKYAESFGDKGNLPLPRAAISRSSPVWMPDSIRRSTPVSRKATLV
jgi:hypothetical protein